MARSFFPVKSGGTCTGAGSEAATPTANANSLSAWGMTGTWASNFSSASMYYDDLVDLLTNASTAPAAGDIVVLSSLTDTNYANVTITFVSGVHIIVVDDANIENAAKSTTENLTANSNDRLDYRWPNDPSDPVYLSGYWQHFADTYTAFYSVGLVAYFRDITIQNNATSANKIVYLGTNSFHGVFSNCDLDNTSGTRDHVFNPGAGARLTLFGGTAAGKNRVFTDSSGYGGVFRAYGQDYSGSSSGAKLAEITDATVSGQSFHFNKCKLPAAWVFGTINKPGGVIIVESCDSEYQFIGKTLNGTFDAVTDTYYTDSKTMDDGSTQISYEFIGDATNVINDTTPIMLGNVGEPRFLLAVNDDAANKSTAVFHFVSQNGEQFDSKDIVIYLLYPDSTNTYLFNHVLHWVSPIEDGAALTTESGKWTGSGLGTQYKLGVSMPSNGDGKVMAWCGFTNASDVASKQMNLSVEITFEA